MASQLQGLSKNLCFQSNQKLLIYISCPYKHWLTCKSTSRIELMHCFSFGLSKQLKECQISLLRDEIMATSALSTKNELRNFLSSQKDHFNGNKMFSWTGAEVLTSVYSGSRQQWKSLIVQAFRRLRWNRNIANTTTFRFLCFGRAVSIYRRNCRFICDLSCWTISQGFTTYLDMMNPVFKSGITQVGWETFWELLMKI